jgi:hypothetical protein
MAARGKSEPFPSSTRHFTIVYRGKAEHTIEGVPAKLEWRYDFVVSILVSLDDVRKLPGFDPHITGPER